MPKNYPSAVYAKWDDPEDEDTFLVTEPESTGHAVVDEVVPVARYVFDRIVHVKSETTVEDAEDQDD